MTNPNDVIANLLIAGGLEIVQNDLELARKLETWLGQNHKKILSAFDAEARSRFSREEIAAIPAQILLSFGPTSSAVRILGILANAVDQANRLYKRQLPLPPIGQVRRRPKSPWSPDLLENADRANLYVAAFGQMLKSRASAAPIENYRHLVLVIPSAILFGGLLHRDSLVALFRSCAEPTKWNYLGQRLQLEMRISWRREADAERRFWFPDALTALLLMRFREEIAGEAQTGLAALARVGDASDASIGNLLWTEVLGPFRRAVRAGCVTVKSLHQLLVTATCRYRMAIPEVLIAYMTREIRSSSLRRSALARVHEVRVLDGVDDQEPKITRAEDSEVDREPGVGKRDLTIIEADWLNEIRAAFRGMSIRILRSNLQGLAERYAPGPAKRFAEFGAWLLTQPSAFGRRLRLSTVKAYTRILVAKLGPILDGRDPATLSSDELLGEYLEVLEQISESGKRKSLRLTVARAINEFHVFLHRKHEVAPIQPAELGLGRAASGTVDPGLITELEYHRIAAHIRGYSGAADNSAIVSGALLLLQFGFRAGLRRNEGRHLRISDLLLAEPGTSKVAEIRIRPWGTHQLKSQNAIRRLPTNLLFDQEESHRLEKWLAAKLEGNGASNETRLFDSAGPEASNPFDRMISLVVSAMREVTGDRHMRFHHLRHSAASCLFARFMFHGAGISPTGWPAQLMPLPKNEALVSELYQALTDSSGATRKVLFAIARLTGHSDPATDCAYYIHVFDGLQSNFLENSALVPPTDLLVAATSLKSTRAYEIVKKGSPWALANRYAPQPWPGQAPVAQRGDDSELQLRIWLDDLYDFLILSERQSANPLEELAADHGFDPLTAIRMVERARQLRDKCTSNHTLKFPMEVQRFPAKKRLYTPRRPHLWENRKLARELATGIAKALRDFPAESRDAIRIWVDRVRLGETQIIIKRFDHASSASAFRMLLDRAGIAFRWISFDHARGSKWIARWRRELRIDGSTPIEIRQPPPHAAKLAHRRFAIEPRCPAVRETHRKSGVNGKEALRFVMTMAAIYAEADVKSFLTQELGADLVRN